MYLRVAALPSPTARLLNIPGGKAGVRTTLNLMRDLIRRGRVTLQIRLAALDIIANKKQKDFGGEISSLFYFVRDYIRYVKDVNGVETLQQPERTLEMQAGDCDDKVILLASFLESIGHPVRLIAVGFRPNHFSHVYLETKIGAKWVALETTEPKAMGWKPVNAIERLTLRI